MLVVAIAWALTKARCRRLGQPLAVRLLALLAGCVVLGVGLALALDLRELSTGFGDERRTAFFLVLVTTLSLVVGSAMLNPRAWSNASSRSLLALPLSLPQLWKVLLAPVAAVLLLVLLVAAPALAVALGKIDGSYSATLSLYLVASLFGFQISVVGQLIACACLRPWPNLEPVSLFFVLAVGLLYPVGSGALVLFASTPFAASERLVLGPAALAYTGSLSRILVGLVGPVAVACVTSWGFRSVNPVLSEAGARRAFIESRFTSPFPLVRLQLARLVRTPSVIGILLVWGCALVFCVSFRSSLKTRFGIAVDDAVVMLGFLPTASAAMVRGLSRGHVPIEGQLGFRASSLTFAGALASFVLASVTAVPALIASGGNSKGLLVTVLAVLLWGCCFGAMLGALVRPVPDNAGDSAKAMIAYHFAIFAVGSALDSVYELGPAAESAWVLGALAPIPYVLAVLIERSRWPRLVAVGSKGRLRMWAG